MLFTSGLVRIGAFRCDPDHPSFPESAPIENYCFWFPRTPVAIETGHESVFVANPNVAALYNRSQSYGRRAIGEHGDNSDWFGVDRALVCEALRERWPDVDHDAERLFPVSHTSIDATTYLLQRQLFEVVKAKPEVDALEVEEIVVLLLDRVLDRVVDTRGGAAIPIHKQHRDLVVEAERLLSQRFDEIIELHTIAAHVGASVYHLCRTFRRITGLTILQYRNSLRLRASLERITESSHTLTDVAIGLGFANHSHFTRAFRREFRQRPSEFRATCHTMSFAGTGALDATLARGT